MHVSTQIFAAAMMLGAVSVSAQSDTSRRGTGVRGSSVVYYGDLDIDPEQGCQDPASTSRTSGEEARGGHATFSFYTESLDHTFAECRLEAVRRTVKQLGAPMVMRVYSETGARESRLSTAPKNHLSF